MNAYLLTPSNTMPRHIANPLQGWHRFIAIAYSLIMAGFIALIIATLNA